MTLPFTRILKSAAASLLTFASTMVWVPSKEVRSSPAWSEKLLDPIHLKAWSPLEACIGIDLGKIDEIARLEVLDKVGSADLRVGDGREHKAVIAGTARQSVPTRSADDDIRSIIPRELVVTTEARNGIVAARAGNHVRTVCAGNLIERRGWWRRRGRRR